MFVASASRCRSPAGPPLRGQMGAVRPVHCSASAQVDTSLRALSRKGKPVPFSWTLSSSQGLSQDAKRYESELRSLFDSAEADWSTFSVDHGKLMFRDLTGEGTSGPVSKYVVNLQYRSGASSLFKYLMSLEGFSIIDPRTDLASTRANPCQRFVHRGIEGYTCAPVSVFETMGGLKMACPNAVWYDNDIFLNWPCEVPSSMRPATSADVKRDYLMVYAMTVHDVAPGTVQLQQLMWIDFLQGEAGERGHIRFAEGFYKRLVKRLATSAEVVAAR